MTHTIREKAKLLNRVRRIRGQVEAIERALEQEVGCADVMQLIAAARGAMGGLMSEVMEDHAHRPAADRSQSHPISSRRNLAYSPSHFLVARRLTASWPVASKRWLRYLQGTPKVPARPANAPTSDG
jgi:FrmR/RcnR family transcriptional regulator, repressor of rcnA expression